MSELDIYQMYILRIAELISVCQGMSQEQYENWKIDTMRITPMEAVVFMEKVFIIVDRFVLMEIGMGA